MTMPARCLLFCVVTASSTADAQLFRRTARRCAPAVKVAVQAQPVIISPVSYLLAPIQPASYGAPTYRPPLRDPARSAPTSATVSQDIAGLTKAIGLLLDRVEALEGKSGAQAGDAQVPQLVRQHCGKCHDGTGGESGVTFADIAGIANDKAQLAVLKGSMPKTGDESDAADLPPETRQALVAALESMKR